MNCRLVLLGLALFVLAGCGDNADGLPVTEETPSVSDCMDDVLDDRDTCWIDEAYVFAGEKSEGFNEYFMELRTRRPEAFDDCFLLQHGLAVCSGANDDEASHCQGEFDDKYEACTARARKVDAGCEGRKSSCQEDFVENIERCLSDATLVEQDCLHRAAITLKD